MGWIKRLYTTIRDAGIQRALTMLIGGSGVAWYFVCLLAVGNGWGTGSDHDAFRSFMSLSITTIGAALATFVGLILGFQVVARGAGAGAGAGAAQGGQGQGGQGAPPAQGGPPAQGAPPAQNAPAARLQHLAETTKVSVVQWLVALLYLVSLLVALQMWGYAGDGIDESIKNLGKSFLGLVGGALSVLLNLPARSN
jgi:hypothetical protein